MEYLEAITDLVAKVGSGQAENVRRAAGVITAPLRHGGVVQAFGSGHSESVAMEIAGRAGGLVPTNRLALRDLVFYGGEPFSMLEDQLLERRGGVAHRLYELAPVSKEDVFVLASNSGINTVIVEFALLVRESGHGLIAITSLEHSLRSNPRHASGKRLCDIADVVLDNGAPRGDVLLPNHTGGVSSITGSVLAQMVMTEVVRRMELEGEAVPIYLSANIAGGYEHNEGLEARYAGRIRRTA
jgi:uncharacterized phosphosugar-binding protein